MNILAAFTDGQSDPFTSAIIATVIIGWGDGCFIYAFVKEWLNGDD